jgi:hypothetical protein
VLSLTLSLIMPSLRFVTVRHIVESIVVSLVSLTTMCVEMLAELQPNHEEYRQKKCNSEHERQCSDREHARTSMTLVRTSNRYIVAKLPMYTVGFCSIEVSKPDTDARALP